MSYQDFFSIRLKVTNVANKLRLNLVNVLVMGFDVRKWFLANLAKVTEID
jgi:hypothetical protein